jgi:hypothetical protein
VSSLGTPAVLTIKYSAGTITPPNIYAVSSSGNASALASEVDAQTHSVSATIAGPGQYLAGRDAASAATALPATINGTVLAPDGAGGLAGAVVRASSAATIVRTVTDQTGAFSLPVSKGAWLVSVDPQANYLPPAAMTIDTATASGPLTLSVAQPPTAVASGVDSVVAGAPELAAKRTETSRTFQAGNGQFQTIVSAAPLNYRGPDGSWRPINNSLSGSTLSGYALESAANSFTVRFKDGPQATDGSFASVSLPGGGGFTLGLPGATPAPRTNEGSNGLVYRGIAPGTDLHYVVGNTGVKEALVLSNAIAPASYSFRLTPSPGTSLSAARRADGSWAFSTSGSALPLFVLERPSVIDNAQPTTSLSTAGGTSGPANLTVLPQADGSFQLQLGVDPGWLADPARIFPVLLDPSVTIQPNSNDANFTLPNGAATSGTQLLTGGNTESTLQFNLGQIPAGNVTSAYVSLYWQDCYPLTFQSDGCGFFSGNGQSSDVGLYQMTAAWSMSSTANTLSYNSTYLSHVTFAPWWGGDQPRSWRSWTVPNSLINNWLSGAAGNYGFLLGPPGGSNVNFAGSAATDPTLAPSLYIAWTGDASRLYQPQIVHSNGAELNWDKFPAATGANFLRYEIHRSATPNFTPSAATLIGTLTDKGVTRYIDTTGAPSTSFSYQIVTITDSASSPSNFSDQVTLATPADGQAIAVLQPGPAGQATTLKSDGPTGNFGTEAFLWARGGDRTWRSLLTFDLRSLPANVTVNSATLGLYSIATSNSPGTIEAHRVTAAWDESQATWNQRLSGTNWTNAGGDFDSTVAASTTANASGQGWETYTLTSLVQTWLNGTQTNYGLLLKRASEAAGAASWDEWNSDDRAGNTALTPKLSITYTDGSHALAPAVSFGAPGGGNTISGSSVALTAAASDDGAVTKVEFYADGSGTPFATDTAGPYTTTLDSTALSRGSHNLSAKAYDNVGNTATSQITVTVANSLGPTAAIASLRACPGRQGPDR